MGSEGSSSSETLASVGPSLDDRRAILTSGVFEFMEELESKDTCLGTKEQTVIVSEKEVLETGIQIKKTEGKEKSNRDL